MSNQKPSISPNQRQQKRRSTTSAASQRVVIIGFAIIAMLALVVFVVRSGSQATLANINRADLTNEEAVAMGKQLYTTRCASCHGTDLQGEAGWPQRSANGVMPASPLDASGTTWQRDDHWIFNTIKHGGQATTPSVTVSFMPAMGGGLTDAEIWTIISYIKQSWPAEIQQQQPTQ